VHVSNQPSLRSSKLRRCQWPRAHVRMPLRLIRAPAKIARHLAARSPGLIVHVHARAGKKFFLGKTTYAKGVSAFADKTSRRSSQLYSFYETLSLEQQSGFPFFKATLVVADSALSGVRPCFCHVTMPGRYFNDRGMPRSLALVGSSNSRPTAMKQIVAAGGELPGWRSNQVYFFFAP